MKASGLRSGVDPSGDIFGCLFFHVKQELREFATRIKEFDINIHHTQYDPRLLSKGMTIGALPSFPDASFDRIDIGDMGDRLGISECLDDWGVLLDKSNPHSCVLAHSVRWIESQPTLSRVQLSSPEKVLDFLKWRCRNIPSLVGRFSVQRCPPCSSSHFAGSTAENDAATRVLFSFYSASHRIAGCIRRFRTELPRISGFSRRLHHLPEHWSTPKGA